MPKPKKSLIEQALEIDAAVWFDIARNGFKKCCLITMHDRRFAMKLGRLKLAGDAITEGQARFGLGLLTKIEKYSRPCGVATSKRLPSQLAERCQAGALSSAAARTAR